MTRLVYICIIASLLIFGRVNGADPAPLPQTFLGVITDVLPVKTNAVGETQLKLGSTVGGGLLIRWVAVGSPASKVLQEGDILLKLNDTPLGSSAQLGTLVQSLKPGDVAALKVLRAMVSLELEVTLETRPSTIDPPQVTYIERQNLLSREADEPVYDPIQQLNASSPPPRRVWTADQYNHEPGKSPVASVSSQELRRYCITSSAGRRTLLIIDEHDHLLFSGPIDSVQERAAIPKTFRAGLKNAEKSETPVSHVF